MPHPALRRCVISLSDMDEWPDLSAKYDLNHAMHVGMLIGYLNRQGVQTRPTATHEGDYTPVIEVTIPNLGIADGPLVLRLLVQASSDE